MLARPETVHLEVHTGARTLERLNLPDFDMVGLPAQRGGDGEIGKDRLAGGEVAHEHLLAFRPQTPPLDLLRVRRTPVGDAGDGSTLSLRSLFHVSPFAPGGRATRRATARLQG